MRPSASSDLSSRTDVIPSFKVVPGDRQSRNGPASLRTRASQHQPSGLPTVGSGRAGGGGCAHHRVKVPAGVQPFGGLRTIGADRYNRIWAFDRDTEELVMIFDFEAARF